MKLETKESECYNITEYDNEYANDNFIYRLKRAKNLLCSKNNLKEILHEISRHNSFSYINFHSIENNFFKTAEKSLDNGYIYLILSKSKSTTSEIIGLFTNKTYNHISIAFESNLDTIISYNGGEKVLPPGLHSEHPGQLMKKNGASVLVYRLNATYIQKKIILDRIKSINNEGSSYNILGFLMGGISLQPNIMVCSQFVYSMLMCAGLEYFQKPFLKHIKPTDFIEKDYHRKLQFITKLEKTSD